MIDIHCHILPDLDDGAKNLEEAIQMCNIAFCDGIKTIVATPHTMNGIFINNRQIILKTVTNLNKALKNNNINLSIIPGAEVHINYNILDLLNQGAATTINDQNKYIMLEFPVYTIPSKISDLIFELKLKGITPIFAHPERNIPIQNNLNYIYHLIKYGGLIQITALSLTGEFGTSAQKCALKMLQLNLVHIIASDAHSTGVRAPRLSNALKVASEIIGESYAEKMVTIFPQAVISGCPLDEQIPEPKAPEKSFFQRLFNISR